MNEKLQQDHHKVKADEQGEKVQYRHGRGAQFNTKNRFIKNEFTQENVEAVDDWEAQNIKTQYIEMQSKTIVNKVESKDVGMDGLQYESVCGLRAWLYLLLCPKCA